MVHIEHPGLSCKTISRALGVAETKASQCFRPAVHKVARCLLFDSAGTMAELAQALMIEEQALIREKLAGRANGAGLSRRTCLTD